VPQPGCAAATPFALNGYNCFTSANKHGWMDGR